MSHCWVRIMCALELCNTILRANSFACYQRPSDLRIAFASNYAYALESAILEPYLEIRVFPVVHSILLKGCHEDTLCPLAHPVDRSAPSWDLNIALEVDHP